MSYLAIRIAAILGFSFIGCGVAYSQTEEAFNAEVEQAIKRLPTVWDTEVSDAVALSWSPAVRDCVVAAEIIVTDDDNLTAQYDDYQIKFSRGFVELMGQATLFTFTAMFGAIPQEQLPVVLEQHDNVLEQRRSSFHAYVKGDAERPPLFLNYGYVQPYQQALGESFSGFPPDQIRHAADMLNGAVLLFVLLHEAGHHVYRNCREEIEISTLLSEEEWADEFSWRTFQASKYPTLLTVDALRIMHAYYIDDSHIARGSLQCRLSAAVGRLEYPDPDVFVLHPSHRANASVLSSNLAQLIPVFDERYTTDDC